MKNNDLWVSSMKQVDESDWKEIIYPIMICELPLFPKELTEKFDLKFFSYIEDGLGEMEAAIINIDGSLFWLKCPTDQDQIGTMVSVRSHEVDTQFALSKILTVLNVDKTKLNWVANGLGKAKFILIRLDDNNNEIEMFRFHDKKIADTVQEKYETKGHKQIYFIKNIT